MRAFVSAVAGRCRPASLIRIASLAALALVSLALLPLATASATAGDTNADRVFGQGGSFTTIACNNGGLSAASLCNPFGVAFDGAGHLYIADANNGRVLEYDTPLISQTATRTISTGAGSFPQGVTIDPAGRLWVAVAGAQVFEYDTPLTSAIVTRTLTFDPGTVPEGLLLDGFGRLFVADEYYARVIEVDSPLTGSTMSRQISLGSGGVPLGIALDTSGRLYVADSGNNRVLEYDNPATSLTPNHVIGQSNFITGICNAGGVSASSLCHPNGLAFTGGKLYVADGGNNRVLVYNDPLASCGSCDATGDQVYGQAGSMVTVDCDVGGINAGTLCAPQGLAFDAGGNLYIADGHHHRALEYDAGACVSTPMPFTGSISAGGTLSTDTANTGATTCQQIQAAVASPNSGAVSINVRPTTTPGSGFLGEEVQITAPTATSASPLVLTFAIDASLVPAGQDQNTLNVFKDGAHVFNCNAGVPTAAAPDPCVASRSLLPGGDIQFVVRTSSASVWNFGPFTAVGGSIELLTQSSGAHFPWGVAAAVASLLACASFGAWRVLRRRVD